MGEDDGRVRGVNRGFGGLDGGVRQVDDHTQAVHFFDDTPTELSETLGMQRVGTASPWSVAGVGDGEISKEEFL